MDTRHAPPISQLGCFISVLLILCLVAGSCQGIGYLAYLHDTEPKKFWFEVVKFLLESEEEAKTATQLALVDQPSYDYDYEDERGRRNTITSSIQPFHIKYWDGSNALFYADPKVWSASIEANQTFPWCDPRLITAIAFSESRYYTNHHNPNPASALGVWQFITSTWDRLWGTQMPQKVKAKFPNPERTDIQAAAHGACYYSKLIGLTNARNQQQFQNRFMGWNRHPPQAEFVWRLYQELLQRTGGDDGLLPPTISTGDEDPDSFTLPFVIRPSLWAQMDDFRKLIVEILIENGFLSSLIIGHDDSPGKDEGGDEPTPTCSDGGIPLLKKYRLGPRGYHTGCEGTAWSCGNIVGYDYIAPDGTPYYAPFDGKVIAQWYDQIKPHPNSVQTIRFVNGYLVGIMHLHFTLRPGQKFQAGQVIGTVGNIGNSDTPHGHIWLQKNGVNISDHSMLFCK